MIQDHPKQMILLLTPDEKVNSSLMLHPSAHITHLTWSQHTGIVSSHIITGRVSTVHKDNLKERDHTHIALITVHRYNCFILLLVIVVNILLCLYHRYVQEKT